MKIANICFFCEQEKELLKKCSRWLSLVEQDAESFKNAKRLIEDNGFRRYLMEQSQAAWLKIHSTAVELKEYWENISPEEVENSVVLNGKFAKITLAANYQQAVQDIEKLLNIIQCAIKHMGEEPEFPQYLNQNSILIKKPGQQIIESTRLTIVTTK
jgi:CRISPR/Cas system CSM-associated protein Csm2 small subunit